MGPRSRVGGGNLVLLVHGSPSPFSCSSSARYSRTLSSSYLFAENDTIESNPVGILARSGSVVRVTGLTISGNTGDGVRLESSSTALFGGNVITGNGGNGVAVNDLSFAGFNGDNVSGNANQPDVACYPQFSATRGAGTVGGTTNCPN